MKNILAVVLLVFTLSANAFWNNNGPWGNSYNNYGNSYGYKDNGIFAFNPYNYWDPRWYVEEMSNMMDEFDDNDWDNNYGGYGYNPYNRNNRNNGYNRYNPYNSPLNNSPWNDNHRNNESVNKDTK